MKLLIAGDFVPQYRVSKILAERMFSDVFEDVRKITDSVDFSIINLEAPLEMENAIKIEKSGPNLKAPIETVDALKYMGFRGVTLANNHLRDYGDECVINTINILKSNRIYTVGAGVNIHDASKTLYINCKGKTIGIINCCEHEYSIASDVSAGSNPLNAINQYYSIQDAKLNADYIVVIVHGGIEGYNLPTPRMQQTYRFFIDAGADVVVNHHQHCFSGYEIYNNKPIFYGLGNFCFDWPQRANRLWSRGYMVEFVFDKDIYFQLHPYEQCDKEPKVNLLNEIEQKEFMAEIDGLNKTIGSPVALYDEYENLKKSTYKNYKALFSPYDNRILDALYLRRLLPGFMTRKKWHSFMNKIECESHRERLIDMINRQV